MSISERPIKIDFHTHSHFSPDANTTMQEMIDEAIKVGITHLAFTDHVDLDADLEATPVNWDFDRDASEKLLTHYKTLYSNQIKLYQGLEIGVQPHLSDKNTQIVSSNPYDFVIASLHAVDRRDLYQRLLLSSNKPVDAIRKYYEDYYSSVMRFNAYSVLGHLDLYLRYHPELAEVPYSKYSDYIDTLLKMIIEDGKGIEINAGGYRYGLGSSNPSASILKRYRELGGEIITYGSDAHTPSYLGHEYEANMALLVSTGFKYICTFEQMHPKFHKIVY